MYDLIDAKRSTRKLYTEALIGRGDITLEEAEQALRDYQGQLERAFTETREAAEQPAEPGSVVRPSARGPGRHAASPTAISAEALKRMHRHPGHAPRGLHRRTRGCCRSCSAGPRWSTRTRSTGRWARRSPSARC